MELDILRFFNNACAVALSKPEQLLGDRGLPIRDHWPAGIALGVNEKRLAVLPDDPAAVMLAAFIFHPLVKP